MAAGTSSAIAWSGAALVCIPRRAADRRRRSALLALSYRGAGGRAALDERHATVFIHPGTTPRMLPGAADYHLAPDFCSPAETALALCRLVVGKVTIRYPHVRIIAAAMGGSLPFFAHRFDAGMRKSHPGLYEELGGVLPQLRRLWYDTSMTEEPYALDSVRHSIGIDRLVFGSDLPRGPLADAVSFVTSSPLLAEQEKTRILEVAGEQVLGRDMPASATGSQR